MSVVTIRTTEDTVLCELLPLNGNPEFEKALFIPFEACISPAPDAAEFEVDSTFFLLFDDIQKEPHS